jgi:membrane-associated phospholipid phosphatase
MKEIASESQTSDAPPTLSTRPLLSPRSTAAGTISRMLHRLRLSFLPLLLAGSFLSGSARAQVSTPRECTVTSLQMCALHVVQDEAAIITSPLRTKPADLLWIAPFGVATGVALHYDAQALQSLGVNVSRQDQWRKVSDAGIYGPIASVGVGYLVGAVKHNDYLRQTAVLAGEAIVDSVILNQGLKYATDRQDPMQGDGTGRFWPHGTRTWPDGTSMPSNHSMIVWSFAHVIGNRYPGWGTQLIVYSLASTVSVSRVLARDHFPSDVVVGSTFGYLIGGFVARHRGNDYGPGGFSFSAVQTENGPAMQVSYNFAHHAR